MLPVDFNLLIGVLIFATVFVYILILRKLVPKSISAKSTPKQDLKKDASKNMEKKENSTKELPEPIQQKQTRSGCSHHFGYLKTLPKNTALPDECLGCPKIIKCLAYELQGKVLDNRNRRARRI